MDFVELIDSAVARDYPILEFALGVQQHVAPRALQVEGPTGIAMKAATGRMEEPRNSELTHAHLSTTSGSRFMS